MVISLAGLGGGAVGQGLVAPGAHAPSSRRHEHQMVGKAGLAEHVKQSILSYNPTETAGCDEHVRWCERGGPQGTPLLDCTWLLPASASRFFQKYFQGGQDSAKKEIALPVGMFARPMLNMPAGSGLEAASFLHF